ncbi:MAG: hypothetical protein LBC84_04270 [Prevotellaceae bacterium]|jgi:pimeloyl-ACP methyl ester carboxylesterase|nr:hypothetical protein [Prevotellaceae bacterium]
MKPLGFFLTFSLFFVSCSQMDMVQPDPIEYSVFKYESANYASLDNFDPLLQDLKDYLIFLDKKMTFSIAALKYATVDPNGKEVWASGLVFHPINKKSRGVIESMPTAHIDSEGGGTDEMYVFEGILILLGYTVIIPDLIGSGISKDLQIPFMMAENTGRVAYDMRRAASQYLWDQFRYAIPTETTIMGYSLGGSAALATQKYYETRCANSVKVKEVYASSGAYDLEVAFDVFSKTGQSTYPAIPSTVLAYKHYYFDCHDISLDLSKIFTGDLLANYSDWYSGKYMFLEILDMIGTDLHAYMHPDFFLPKEEHNEELKKLYSYLAENDLTIGWRPKAPIYMTHAKVDTHVPVECAEIAVKRFRKAGANISFITYPGTHNTVGYLFFVRQLFRFLI